MDPPVSPCTRRWACLTTLASGLFVVAVSAQSVTVPAKTSIDWVWIGSFSRVATMYDQGMAYDASRDRTVMYGGFGCSVPGAQTWEWDGTTWKQRFPTVSPPPRGQTRMVYDSHRKRIVIFGGGYGPIDFDDLWEWDGTTWTTPDLSLQSSLPNAQGGPLTLRLSNLPAAASVRCSRSAARGSSGTACRCRSR